MGKIQDGMGKSEVKREVVSASANLEVISEESFVKRLEGMSSACVNCQRERNRGQRSKPARKSKGGRRKQHSKANMPIVIHLKDSLRAAAKHRQHSSSVDGDSDVSTRSTDEEQYRSSSTDSTDSNTVSSIYGDVASIPEFVPQYSALHFHPAWPQTHVSQASHRLHATVQKAKDKSRKNLTALISVIEKAHRKDAKDIEPNLSRNSPDGKLCNILNNAALSTLNDSQVKRNNVQLICNDLSTAADKLSESTDESDSSDKASVVSSTDTLSDDVSDLPAVDEGRALEFSPDALEQLVEYTTGMPLVRYDCPPSQCPECSNALYSYQYFQYEGCSMYTAARPAPIHYHSHFQQQRQPACADTRKKTAPPPRSSTSSDSDVSSDVEEDSSTASRSSSQSSSSSSSASSSNKAVASVKSSMGSISPESPTTQPAKKVTKNSRSNSGRWNWTKASRDNQSTKRATASWKGACQLWDIDVFQASRRAHMQAGSSFTDSVFMDLTGLDVTISVMYHTEHSSPPLTPTWPYPVHSLYPAMYTSSIPGPSTYPLRLYNYSSSGSVFYPQTSDMLPPYDFKKYEMTLPPNRPWITTGSPDKDVPAAVFTVMCYNVLCDKLCTKAMYAYCPTWALNWDYRKKGIMNDILRGNADIITLQEVETEQYHSMFLPELAHQGYDGIFLPKSRVRTMNSDKEKKSVDGCAIFFKNNKFEKVNEYQVEFNQLATKEGASNTDTDMINRVSTKDNIAIVAVLRTKPAVYENSPVPCPKGLTQMLMVSTAHIHWDPQLPDVKLVQTMMLIEELQKFVKEASMQFRPNAPPPSLDADLCNSMPLILCGDFNSLPDSGVYEYLSKGRLDTNHKDFEGQNYQVFMKDRNDNGIITHNFKLTSAYKDVIPFTNYTFDFKGIIDYIFYSDQHLRLHGVMGLQDEEWFRANKIIGCPHPFVPSDHFPLFAEFSLPAPAQRPR